MATTLEQNMQGLSVQDVPNRPATEMEVAKPRKRARPMFHKTFRSCPRNVTHRTNRYWHFGWPVSDELVNTILDTYTPEYLDEERSAMVKYAHFSRVIKSLAGCSTIRQVLVEPPSPAWAPSPLADDGEKGVGFCMVVSDCGKHFFTKRPTKEQMGRLKFIFGSEPCWMMDARDKSQWRHYGYTK
ncbi:hypothetical protein BD626DRAFT_555871 [Schizophyllum amplum]|uniref:Uncharacterized protein n=1 Tax=Schizophyllum amplum TaxID=97359 RepID=A0A550CLT9_9AGAR|nr:hypothetical protein BD626DRAFT_555871 [Auriculariopsis ampla]